MPCLGGQMKRREFISLLGCALSAWPVVAQGQHGERVRLIGVLLPAVANDPGYLAWLDAFRPALTELGWVEDRNVRIDIHWAMGPTNIRRKAAELIALAPDVILAPGTNTVGALMPATRTVPIVFPIITDPISGGFVDSLAHPGGNAT